MVFSSLLFVFLFLALNLLVYSLVPARYKNYVLLGFSLVFYAWGGPQYLLLLLAETAISWFCAQQIEQRPGRKKVFMILESVSLLGLLAIFKYLSFILTNLQNISGFPESVPTIVLPIGISFYTFQLLSYVIDVYNNKVKAQPVFWKLLLYSSLFHQCIAGPIVRYETVANEIDSRSVNLNDIYYGVRRFCIGLAKKAVLANGMAAIADTLLVDGELAGLPVLAYWFGMFCYMLEIYLDFSAYSDMAIGMGRMVGFHYLENFNYPYMAKSVQEFWRRWHISLSSFFRDYVYIPLGGSRGSTWVYVRNMIVVWFLTGLWHGASWNFILWGLYYLVFLLLEKFVIKQSIPDGLNRLYTLSVIYFGWILFRFDSLSDLGTVLLGMIGIGASGFGSAALLTTFLSNLFLLIVCIIACTNLSVLVRNGLRRFSKQNSVGFWIYTISECVTPALLLCLSVLSLIGASYNPFIYFRF
jgi:alginate O-acetyltransferase complex protein AlgI